MAEREGLLPFKLIEDETGEALTSYSGLPLVLETCEALGLTRLVKQHVHIKQRQRGYSEPVYVQSVMPLIAAGGGLSGRYRAAALGRGVEVIAGRDHVGGGGSVCSLRFSS